MNSALYEMDIMHHRLTPKEHRFSYKFFSFYLDLDEIDMVAKKIRGFSHNRFNVYGFYDEDHIPAGKPTVKENVLDHLKTKGIDLTGGRVMLLTYLRTFGYVFNPVSFYFCFDKDGSPVCVLPEIGNTFGELKMFLLGKDCMAQDTFNDRQDKYYYISPFTKLDDQLQFRITIPNEHLNIRIDTVKGNGKILLTSMMGNRRELTNKELMSLTLKFPLITFKVIALIHWHAFLLWLKKVPYQEKTSNPHLQKEVFRAWHNN